jgi:hypothetical protein
MWEMPYREIVEELTCRNIPTPRGGEECDVDHAGDEAIGDHWQVTEGATTNVSRNCSANVEYRQP